MIAFGYLGDELRRRWGRTVVTALGLAAGVGLVMGIIGVSAGLSAAQNQALSPLSSVGTDIIVTRTVGATTTAAASPSPSLGQRRAGGPEAAGSLVQALAAVVGAVAVPASGVPASGVPLQPSASSMLRIRRRS